MKKYVLILAFAISVGVLFASLHSSVMPEKKASLQITTKSEFVLCTWNIAHYYAYGSSKKVIDGAIYDSKLKEFREVLYDSINADLISLNEYSPIFGTDKDGVEHLSSNILFDGYNSWIEGGATKKGTGHNAIYSNVRMGNFKKHEFDYIKTTKYKDSHDDYYYISADMFVGEKLVKFVCLYLIYSTKDASLVQNQIAELIEKYKNEKRVVICGDFNTSNYSKFKKAGYSLANDGSIITFYKKSKPLDNVAAKGVKISDVHTVNTTLSDHYPLVCKITVN
jgi:endonuclease/exonuclease/phosphatase family metal-dependent hydrolase